MKPHDWQVLWNGRRNHPGGASLFTEDTVRQSPAPRPDPVRGSVSAALRALRPQQGSDWFTVREVETLLHVSRDQAHNALSNLQRQGLIERERIVSVRTTKVQRYRWRQSGS